MSIGRYVLTPEIFDVLKKQKSGAGGEIQLADAINSQAQMGRVASVNLNGKRFDFMGQVPFLKKPIYNLASKIILKTDKPLVVGI